MLHFSMKDYGSEENAVERIAKTILKYALRDGAKAIRFEFDEKVGFGHQSLRIYYLLDERGEPQWKEQMRIPDYVREPVMNYYRELFGVENILLLRFGEKQQNMLLCYKITSSWKSEQQNEDLILTIEHDISTELNEYSKWI